MASTRRHFFFGSLLAGAIPTAGFGSVPSLRTLGYKSPNEKLNIASIGAGGKASSDISGCSDENIVALCDVDDARAAGKFKQYEKVPKYKDFRKMLDEQGANIDAVIIAIPDFMHATAAMWAMERGKHVYVQKPLTRTIWEARQIQDAANKYGSPPRWAIKAIRTKAPARRPKWFGPAKSATSPKSTPGPIAPSGRKASP